MNFEFKMHKILINKVFSGNKYLNIQIKSYLF